MSWQSQLRTLTGIVPQTVAEQVTEVRGGGGGGGAKKKNRGRRGAWGGAPPKGVAAIFVFWCPQTHL